MYRIAALVAIAAADVARTVWVLDAVLAQAADPVLVTGLILASGGLSLAMLGLVMRAAIGRRLGGTPSR